MVFYESEFKVKEYLSRQPLDALDECAEFAWRYHADHQLFWIFDAIISPVPLNLPYVENWVDREPLLVFSVLKKFVPSETGFLHEHTSSLGRLITKQIIRSANIVGIASLVALEKIKGTIATLNIVHYLELLELAAMSVRSPELVQEILLVLHECREITRSTSASLAHIHQHALAIACDRAEEAGDECPCDENGRPRKQHIAPALVPLFPVEGKLSEAVAHIRVDAPSAIRLHSHVRLRAASKPEKGHVEPSVLDAIVLEANAGEVKLLLIHTPPPEYVQMQWYIYNAGSVGEFQ